MLPRLYGTRLILDFNTGIKAVRSEDAEHGSPLVMEGVPECIRRCCFFDTGFGEGNTGDGASEVASVRIGGEHGTRVDSSCSCLPRDGGRCDCCAGLDVQRKMVPSVFQLDFFLFCSDD